MPIYPFTYRPFEGKYIRRFRWWVVFTEEIRLWNKSRIFQILFLIGMLQPFIRFLQILAYNSAMQDPNHPLAPLIRTVTWFKVDSEMYYHFIRLQAPCVLIMLLFVGAGAICADRKNRLWEIYFSKPIHWYDYLIGKILAVCFAGYSLTFFPSLILMFVDYITQKGSSIYTLVNYLPLIWKSFSFSSILVVPCALGIIAGSSIFPTENITVISVITIVIANTTLAGLLSNFLKDANYMQISLPVAIYFMGQKIFNVTRNMFFRTEDISTLTISSYILIASIVFLIVSVIQVRKAERG